jgi:hypothetical protein
MGSIFASVGTTACLRNLDTEKIFLIVFLFLNLEGQFEPGYKWSYSERISDSWFHLVRTIVHSDILWAFLYYLLIYINMPKHYKKPHSHAEKQITGKTKYIYFCFPLYASKRTLRSEYDRSYTLCYTAPTYYGKSILFLIILTLFTYKQTVKSP